MAQQAAQDGIHTIVATPHTLNGIYINSARDIKEKTNWLQAQLTREGIDIQLCTGADVHLAPNLVECLEQGTAMTIQDAGRYVLLELPSQAIPPRIKEEIFSLKVNGITPIITHPERNMIIQQDLDMLAEMVSMGALSQVTAMSINGEFGSHVKQFAESILSRRLAHVIASDAHSEQGRPPLLSRAVEEAARIIGDRDEALAMATDIPETILSGRAVEVPDPSDL